MIQKVARAFQRVASRTKFRTAFTGLIARATGQVITAALVNTPTGRYCGRIDLNRDQPSFPVKRHGKCPHRESAAAGDRRKSEGKPHDSIAGIARRSCGGEKHPPTNPEICPTTWLSSGSGSRATAGENSPQETGPAPERHCLAYRL